ncbi:MAG: hypothetical protein KZQ86_06220 [Candidatus Thiodiazotropha sp. (ex Lucinoma kastoroae)]|nr:hypothetical protein [Candidatus Thiodiazotropha sp. (ex Lucinoma kastoroae)]
MREGVEEFVVVDGNPWERYDYYVNRKSKIYAVSGKVLYQGIRDGKHYLVINNDAVDYGDSRQVNKAIKKQLDPYLANEFQTDNQVKQYNNRLEIGNKKYSIKNPLAPLYLYRSGWDSEIFTILKVRKSYLWATKNNGLISINYDGREIGTFDDVGKFRMIGGRLVFAATKDNRAGLVINGEEWLKYEMPEGERLGRGISRFNKGNIYTPLDFDGRIVFKAYKDGKYFVVEEKHGQSVKQSGDNVRIVSTR